MLEAGVAVTEPGRQILLVAYFYPPCRDTGVLRTASMTRWLRKLNHRVTVLTTSAYGEAADDREEACAIAVALRDAVREETRTAVLVTPDRTLAERVSSELMRWGIAVDDSAGQALDRSPAGAFARLAAEAWSGAFEANALLALVAHPLFRLGLAPETLRRGRTALEIGELKRRLKRPIYDPERERLIVERLIARAPEPLAPDQVRRVFERLIDESRRAELARDG